MATFDHVNRKYEWVYVILLLLSLKVNYLLLLNPQLP